MEAARGTCLASETPFKLTAFPVKWRVHFDGVGHVRGAELKGFLYQLNSVVF